MADSAVQVSQQGYILVYLLLITNRVHRLNTVSLALAFLPYHDQSLFLNFLLLLPDSLPSRLRFLHPYRTSLSNIPSSAICYAAITTPAVFAAFGDQWVRVGRIDFSQPHDVCKFWLSILLYATLKMAENMRAGNRDAQEWKTDSALTGIVNVMRKAFEKTDLAQYSLMVGAYNMTTILVLKVEFSEQVLNDFMDAIAANWIEATAFERLCCLAIIFQKKTDTDISKAVANSLLLSRMTVDQLEEASKKTDINKLIYSLSLFAVKSFLENPLEEPEVPFLVTTLAMDILDKKQIKHLIKPLLQVLKNTQGLVVDDVQRGVRRSIKLILATLYKAAHWRTVHNAAKKAGVDTDDLDLELSDLARHLPAAEKVEKARVASLGVSPMDVDDLELDDTIFQTVPSLACQQLLKLFHSPGLESKEVAKMLEHPRFKKVWTDNGNSTFIAFCLRLSFQDFPQSVARAAAHALVHTIAEAKSSSHPFDFQVVLPYALCWLANSNDHLRNLGAWFVSTLYNYYKKHNSVSDQMVIWPSNAFYATEQPYILPIPKVITLLEIVMKDLERFKMDSSNVCPTIRSSLPGKKLQTRHAKDPFVLQVADAQNDIAQFLASHASLTPLYSPKAVLLSMLPSTEKTGIPAFRNTIHPNGIMSWLKVDETLCLDQGVSYKSFITTLLGILMHNDEGFLSVFANLLSAKQVSRNLIEVTTDFTQAHWAGRHFSSDDKVQFLDKILDTGFDKKIHGDLVVDVIRSLPLSDTEALHLLDSVAQTFRVQLAVENGTKEILILEAVEGLQLQSTKLLSTLFEILGLLNDIAVKTGAPLDYLKLLCVKTLLIIVENAKVWRITRRNAHLTYAVGAQAAIQTTSGTHRFCRRSIPCHQRL
jgi:U3 small nucleolar RNA-associated protein 10